MPLCGLDRSDTERVDYRCEDKIALELIDVHDPVVGLETHMHRENI
jgi:hypothetical protein